LSSLNDISDLIKKIKRRSHPAPLFASAFSRHLAEGALFQRPRMIQKFDFTTAAMAAALEDTGVTYEELDDIEREFEDVETEISKLKLSYQFIAVQHPLTNPTLPSPPTSPTQQAPLRKAQQDRLAHPQLLAAGH
jgi:hypothetical protein